MGDNDWANSKLKDTIDFNGNISEIDWRHLGQSRLALKPTDPQIVEPDLTFIIPFAADSLMRVINLCLVVSHLLMNTDAKIIITIADVDYSDDELKNNPKLGHNGKNWDYQKYFFATMCQWWIQENFEQVAAARMRILLTPRKSGEPFHRTNYLNNMLDNVTTPFVANLDADVLIDSSSIRLATLILRTDVDGEPLADFVYPYGYGKYTERVWPKNLIEGLNNVLSSEELDPDCPAAGTELAYSMIELITKDNIDLLHYSNTTLDVLNFRWSSAFGHVFFAKTESYKSAYGENEEFISWGAEDIERFVRFTKLGYNIARINNPVIHLEHPRGADSGKENPFFQGNEDLWVSMQNKDDAWLRDYYENCEYYKSRKWNTDAESSIDDLFKRKS